MHYVLDLEQPDEKGPERWFTIASAPFEQHIMLTTRIDGLPISSFKQTLMRLKPGDNVEADGPGGKFTLKKGGMKHVLIAGGIGITPFRSMLAQLAHDKSPINADLLYANRGNAFAFDEELSRIASSNPNFRILKFADKKIDRPDLSGYLPQKDTVYYLSGPKAMVESYGGLLQSLGVDKANIMTDYFPGY